MALALTAVLMLAGCTDDGSADFGSVLADDTLVDNTPPAKGPSR
ncbi:MAG: hypothetical protein R2704_04900 [Microthrixaceae bacterium]